MHNLTEDLIIYSGYENQSVLAKMAELCSLPGRLDEGHKKQAGTCASEVVREIIKTSFEYGLSGNLWHGYIALYIALNENPFSLAYEMTSGAPKQGGVDELAKHDLKILKELFDYDLSLLDDKLKVNYFSVLKNCENSDAKLSDQGINVKYLKDMLETAKNDEEFFACTVSFYKEKGVGLIGLNKAFTVKGDEDSYRLSPVRVTEKVNLSDLVGYEVQKQKLTENTAAFLKGKPANNVLLYGDGGTGKSTSVRAIASRYYDEGLRMIQIYRHQMKHLNRIISEIKNRNYKFIIYMDDLSFEDFETEYKYLKAVIEGGLEPRPENVLIYATSNRRHLIKETWKDRTDMEHTGDLHRSDSMEEKLSLAERFGVQIYYGKPTIEEFHKIVEALALRENIHTDMEVLHGEATKWEIRHGGISGRSARQFIDYIKGTEDDLK